MRAKYRLTLEPERAVALRRRVQHQAKVLQSLEPRAENCIQIFKGDQAWESLTTVEILRAVRSAASG